MPRLRPLAFAFTAVLLVPSVTLATPHVFISEYVEGSSNNKAIEIHNASEGSVNLGTFSIEIYFNGSATPLNTINLPAFTLEPGNVFVVAHSSAVFAAGADLATASLSFNGDDAVVLRDGTTHLDVIGQIGVDPGTEWGAGLVSTADNTIRRHASVCTGDDDGSDVFVLTDWTGFATDTFDGLGTHASACPPDVPGSGGWGLAGMAILMLGGAMLALRRRTAEA